MENKKFREALESYLVENDIQDIYGETIILTDHSYDNSIVGITDDGILVYDYNKMIEEFAADEDCEEIDAIEWIDYNTIRALPYMGERRPIIIMETPTTIIERYGE